MLWKTVQRITSRRVEARWIVWLQHTHSRQLQDAQNRQRLQQLENLENLENLETLENLTPRSQSAKGSPFRMHSIAEITGSVDARSPQRAQRQVRDHDGSGSKTFETITPPSLRGSSFESVGPNTAIRLVSEITGDRFGAAETHGNRGGDQAIALQTFFYRLKESRTLLLSQGWSKWLDMLLLTEVRLTHSEGWEAHDQTCASLTLEIEGLLEASERREAEHERALREVVERQGKLVEEALVSGLAAKEAEHEEALQHAILGVRHTLNTDFEAVTARAAQERRRVAVRTVRRSMEALLKSIYGQTWKCWLKKVHGRRRAVAVLERCGTRTAKGALAQAWRLWTVANLSAIRASKVLDRAVSRRVSSQLLAAWYRWLTWLDAWTRAAMVMQRCLGCAERSVTGAAIDKWKDAVKWHRAQTATATAGNALAKLERFKTQFDQEKRAKAVSLMRRGLGRMCNKHFVRAWARWIARMKWEFRAAEIMEYCLDQIMSTKLAQAWQQWCTANGDSIRASRVMLELTNRTSTKLLIAGWCSWLDVIRSGKRAAVVIESCLVRLERIVIVRGMKRWLSVCAAAERASFTADAVSVALAAQSIKHQAALLDAVAMATRDQRETDEESLRAALSEAGNVADLEFQALAAAHDKSKQDWLLTLKSMRVRESQEFIKSPETRMGCHILFATVSRRTYSLVRQAWSRWNTRAIALASAGQIMQACLNRICQGAMAAGWARWAEYVDEKHACSLDHYRATRFIAASLRRVSRFMLYESWVTWQDHLHSLEEELEETIHSRHVKQLCITIDSTRKRWASRRLKAFLQSCYRVRLQACLRVWRKGTEDGNQLVLSLAADCAASLDWLNHYFNNASSGVYDVGRSHAVGMGPGGAAGLMSSISSSSIMAPMGRAWEPDHSGRSTSSSRLLVPASRAGHQHYAQDGIRRLEIVEAVLRQQQVLLNDMGAHTVSMNAEFQQQWRTMKAENQRAHSMNLLLGKEVKKWQKKAQDMFVLAKIGA
jgi:hypothetical protein